MIPFIGERLEHGVNAGGGGDDDDDVYYAMQLVSSITVSSHRTELQQRFIRHEHDRARGTGLGNCNSSIQGTDDGIVSEFQIANSIIICQMAARSGSGTVSEIWRYVMYVQ